MSKSASSEIISVSTAVVALVGNPNTGKTTLFNRITGSRQRVGNYPGVTIDRKSGFWSLPAGNIEVLDLPGTYSLRSLSADEQVTADALLGRLPGGLRPDLIILVADATNLKRNLFLFTQLAELDIPIVIALTMVDLLETEGLSLDVPRLSSSLGVPVVAFHDKDEISVQNLATEVSASLGRKVNFSALRDRFYPADVQPLLKQISAAGSGESFSLAWFEAANLFGFPDDRLWQSLSAHPALHREMARSLEDWRRASGPQPEQINRSRYEFIAGVLKQSETRRDIAEPFSRRLDRWLTHRGLGFLIFALIMFGVFQALYSGAAPIMDGIEFLFKGLAEKVGGLITGMPAVRSLVTDGIIGGVGSVLVFLPQIMILFLFISWLEDSGYLARASFLMDKILSWTGLNGRAFIPMLSSFACAIPGIMAARVMPDPKARLTTVLISPLMSCSARLPVYLLMISSFIEPQFGAGWAAFTLFAMHALGLLVALPLSWLINRRILRTPDIPFILEMPPYRLPRLKNTWRRVSEAAKKFLLRAGGVIFALSILIWLLSYFPHAEDMRFRVEKIHAEKKISPEEFEKQLAAAWLEDSFLGRFGKAVQPAFAPLGFDWKLTVGIIGAFPAREVIISTLGIIYQVGSDADEESLLLKDRLHREKLSDGRPAYTPLVAISLMIFFALCCQCLSTVVTVARELKNVKWAVFLFTYMTGLAYLFSLAVYQGGRFLGYS